MRCWPVLLALGTAVPSAAAFAEATTQVPVPPTRQLSGLSANEAAALIAKLEEAQRRLKKAGDTQFFELLTGAPASYDMTRVAPRDAFLKVPFDKVWKIERVETGNRLWQPFRLSYAPNGLGHLYWDIEVVLNIYGNLERVLMVYKPPAPF